eukprot:g629.t1
MKRTVRDSSPVKTLKKLRIASVASSRSASVANNVVFRFDGTFAGTLKKRYKRFLADVVLEDNDEVVTAHCPNTGPLLGLLDQSEPAVFLSRSSDPKRKCQFTLEAIQRGGASGKWIGIHSALANKIVRQMLDEKMIPEFSDYDQIKAEVVYGKGKCSRADFMLTRSDGDEKMFVEVKAVTYSELQNHREIGLFPDTISTRAQKHLTELMEVIDERTGATCIFVVMGNDCTAVGPFNEKDPVFSKLMTEANESGVQMIGIGLELRQTSDNIFEFVFQRFLDIDLRNE